MMQHTKYNENAGFLVKSGQTTFYTHILKVYINFQCKQNDQAYRHYLFKHFCLSSFISSCCCTLYWYIFNLLIQVLDEFEKAGGHTWELIEPVDGLHINQVKHQSFLQILHYYINSGEIPEFLSEFNLIFQMGKKQLTDTTSY